MQVSPSRPFGITLIALAFLTAAAIFAVDGLVFAIAPRLLAELGFRPDPELWRRALGLLFFGGVALLLAHVGRGLLRLQRSSRWYVVSLSWAAITLSVIRILQGEGGHAAPLAIGLFFAIVLAYLSAAGVRVAFGISKRDP